MSKYGRGEVLADGRCVPRSRYLLRSVAEERVVRAKTCTYLLRGTLCEMRLEHILPRLLHPVFHINGRTTLYRTSPSPSSYFSPAPVFLFVFPRSPMLLDAWKVFVSGRAFRNFNSRDALRVCSRNRCKLLNSSVARRPTRSLSSNYHQFGIL